MTAAEITRGIEQLKGMCDPRGHDLLDAIHEALLAQAAAVDMVDAAFQMQQTQEWMAGHAPPPYVTTEVRLPADPDIHSRRVPDNVHRIGVSR